MPDHDLLRAIGRGAYGEVWLARNAMGTLRAVKLVFRQDFEDTGSFEREFKGLQKFEPISRLHEGLVQVLQIGRREEEGWFFYVMELADDVTTIGDSGVLAAFLPRTLSAELSARGALPLTDCLAIGVRLASALQFLHEHGLVHRDIKPSNIIFVRGNPKLADIGLVTGMDEARSLVGTAGYIPPEGPGSAQADIYSLGKVLYETAFGKNRQEFPQLPVDLHARADHQGLLELNEIILKSCESDPRSRYETAEQLRADLELLATGGSVKRQCSTKRHRAWAKRVMATAMAGLLVTGCVRWWQEAHQARPLSLDADALGLYYRACYEVRNRGLESLLAAYTNLTVAVRMDPGFVAAYFKMVELYFGPLGNRLPPHYNQAENFRTVAAKLRQVAPNSVQYHTANSLVEFMDWNFDAAIAEAAQAIKLDRNFMRAHGFYGYYVLFARGDADTALKEYETALNLDPERNDTTIKGLLGGPYYFKREYAMAVEKGIEAVEMERQNPFAHLNLAEAYLAVGDYSRCLEEHRQGELACGAKPDDVEPRYEKLREALTRGPEAMWRELLAELESNANSDPYDKAVLHARLGEWDEAISLLKQAFERRSRAMFAILGEPCWDAVRSEPWFQDGLARSGFRPVTISPTIALHR